ncbi:hypothetical protein [Spirochaeta dissipatitropha]
MKKRAIGKLCVLAGASFIFMGLTAACDFFDFLEEDDYFIPGSTSAEAAEVDQGEEYRVNLVNSQDDHWYEITTTNDGFWDRVQISITDVYLDMRVELHVYDSEMNRIINTARPGNAGANLIENFATTGGLYYVRVTNDYYRYPRTGPYTIKIENLDANDQYEPNDTHGDAYDLGQLPVDDPVSGSIVYMSFNYGTSTYSGDWDWFKYEAISDEDIVVHVSHVSDDLRIAAEFRTPGNTHLTTLRADNQGQTGNFTLTGAQSGQVIYMGVRGERVSTTDQRATRGDYTFTISQDP